MARFSIREALKFSFSAWIKYPAILLGVSGLLAFTFWMNEFILQAIPASLGFITLYKQVGKELFFQEWAHRIMAVPFPYLFIFFVSYLAVSAINSFLYLGFAKLSLAIKDERSVSWEVFFTISFRQLVRFISAEFLALACGVGLLAMTVFVNLLPLYLVAIVFAWYWYVVYSFLRFCIAQDSSVTIRTAFARCRSLVSGSQEHLFLAFITFALFDIIINFLLMGNWEITSTKGDWVTFLHSLIPMTLLSLYEGFIYRALQESRK